MNPYDLTTIGQDVLSEASLGWFLINKLSEYSFPVSYRGDGTTPANIVNSFAWVDDPEKHEVVRASDYTDYRTQIPLPIVGYGFVNNVIEPIELGSTNQFAHYTLSIIVASETKGYSSNVANFLRNLLSTTQVPIYDYNNVSDSTQIGVLYCEDFLTSNFYDYFDEPNIATKFSIGITCEAIAELNDNNN